MKVLCINGVKVGELSIIFNVPANTSHVIYEGEIYHVIAEDKIGGVTVYKLRERTHWWYKASRFIPCSDQKNLMMEDVCEKILINQKQKL